MAVANELKKIDPNTRVIFIGQKGDPFGRRLEKSDFIDESIFISAGKFRRYHGAGLKQLLDIGTILKNTFDFFKFLIGTIQAYFVLGRIKPDVIFVKGGYIGVPVGLAAAVRHINFITHDSDTMPGLANRIIAKWAAKHATGMPKEFYDYPKDKTVYVGVPISSSYSKVDSMQQDSFKNQLGIKTDSKLILFTGGGLGSKALNDALLAIVETLLQKYPDTTLINIAGKDHEDSLSNQYLRVLKQNDRERVIIKGFVEDMYKYSGAADLIISRAGATNLAEFAAQAKPCIIIPSPYLVGGHQLKNAKALAEMGAIEVLDENNLKTNPMKLLDSISTLMDSDKRRLTLSENLFKIARNDAAEDLAKLILNQAKE